MHESPFPLTGKSVYAEVKNKYNTLNSGGKEKIFDGFQSAMSFGEYKHSDFFLIEVIQRKPQGLVPWKIANRGINPRIFIVDAATIYEQATGDPQALQKTFTAVSAILQHRHGLLLTPENDDLSNYLFHRAFGRTA